MNCFHFTQYSGADHQQSTSNTRNIHRQSETLGSITAPSLPRWLFSGSTRSFLQHHLAFPIRPPTRSLYYLHCNCSAIKLVFPTKEQGYYGQTLGENPYSSSNTDLCRHSGLHINTQLPAFHEAQDNCTELPLSPPQTWKVSAYTPQKINLFPTPRNNLGNFNQIRKNRILFIQFAPWFQRS